MKKIMVGEFSSVSEIKAKLNQVGARIIDVGDNSIIYFRYKGLSYQIDVNNGFAQGNLSFAGEVEGNNKDSYKDLFANLKTMSRDEVLVFAELCCKAYNRTDCFSYDSSQNIVTLYFGGTKYRHNLNTHSVSGSAA